MKKEISDRADIEFLIKEFYERVKKDERLTPFFSGEMEPDWEHHLPLICDFWESSLWYNGKYSGNMMEIHRNIDSKRKIQPEDFDRWLQIFREVTDEFFTGEKAEKAKQHAYSMTVVLKLKLCPS